MAKKMVKPKELVDSLKVRLPPFGVVEEVEAVSECILHDGIACIRLEHEIHLHWFASDARLLHPIQHFLSMFPDRGLQSSNARNREKRVQGPAPPPMKVVVECTRH